MPATIHHGSVPDEPIRGRAGIAIAYRLLIHPDDPVSTTRSWPTIDELVPCAAPLAVTTSEVRSRSELTPTATPTTTSRHAATKNARCRRLGGGFEHWI